jgi:hypothetical protein
MWKRIEKRSGWHTCYDLNGNRLKAGQNIALKLGGDNVQIGSIVINEQRKEGRGGMDESYSWEDLYLRTNLHGLEVEIVLKEGMEARRI